MRKAIPQDSDILCWDCKHPLSLIQQADALGGHIPLLTCWNPTCLLRGVTLSTGIYLELTEAQLEAYRAMNRVSQVRYLKSDDGT